MNKTDFPVPEPILPIEQRVAIPDLIPLITGTVEGVDETQYLRTGGCSRGCGACCQDVIVEIVADPKRPNYADWLKWLTLHNLTVVERDNSIFLHIPIPCSALNLQNGDCGLYGQAERPDMCSAYPAHPLELMGLEKVCTYQFTPLARDNRYSI